MKLIWAIMVVFTWGSHSVCGQNLYKTTVYADDYRPTWLSSANRGTSVYVQITFEGTFSIPKLHVPSGIIKKVTVKSIYSLGAAGAGYTAYELTTGIAHFLPSPAFDAPVSDYARQSNGRLPGPHEHDIDIGGFNLNIGPAVFTASSPGEFRWETPDNPAVVVPVKLSATADGFGKGSAPARLYAVAAHVFPVFEVTYELDAAYPFVPPFNGPAQPLRSFCSSFGTSELTSVPSGCEWWPGEIWENGKIECRIQTFSPKKFDISLQGLPGFRYTLQRSDALSIFEDIEYREGAGSTITFSVNDTARQEPRTMFRVKSSKIP